MPLIHKFKILRWARTFLTLVIFFFLAMQAFAGLVYHPPYHGDSYFPFMDYPMFKAVYKIGSEMPFYRVFAILETAQIVEIKPETLDLDYWKFEWGIVQELRNENLRYEKIQEYAAMYYARYGKKVISFRLENHPRVYLGGKLGFGERRVLKHVDARREEDKKG